MVETTIVSHLTGILTPDIVSQLQMPIMIYALGGLILTIVAVSILLCLLGAVIRIISPTRSQAYRSLMSDMFVIGMIKKFAKEDDIDLVKELKEFAKIERKKKLSYKDIDSVIADNLKEKIDAKTEKELEKIEGQKEQTKNK